MSKRIGLQEIRALPAGQVIWDATVPGFGARRQKSAAISYVLFYRTREGRQRWHTIGRHGAPWTPETARKEAQRLLGDVVGGGDPAADKTASRKAKTISELCDLYLADAEAGRILTRRRIPKKPSTLATDRGRILRHIKPILGNRPVAAVTREDIEDFMHAVARGDTAGKTKTKARGLARVRGGRGTASRTVGLLGAIFTYAVRYRMRTDNPVHGVARFADGKRERRLSNEEYELFDEALRRAEDDGIWPPAISAARFLALTGWRSGEALDLQWRDLDLDRNTAQLPDTKTGYSLRPLSSAACNILSALPRVGERVFPASRGSGAMSGFPKLWARISAKVDLPTDVTPNVLRHSFISLAADLGFSEPTIGALVGHKGHSVTSRYVHLGDGVLLVAADKVANETLKLMLGKKEKTVVVALARRNRRRT